MICTYLEGLEPVIDLGQGVGARQIKHQQVECAPEKNQRQKAMSIVGYAHIRHTSQHLTLRQKKKNNKKTNKTHNGHSRAKQTHGKLAHENNYAHACA